MTSKPYNPLDKINLARSIEQELRSREAVPLGGIEATGAGVYAIYYAGAFEPYRPISGDPNDLDLKPIYVGKAIRKGGRKGGLTKDAAAGTALRDRLRKHAASIDEAANLSLTDFWARYLVVDDIWIPLGENMLIDEFGPVWNRVIDGFGNNDPGIRRSTQYRSPWDVLHPGRAFTIKLADSALTAQLLIERVADYFAGRPLTKLPKAVEREIEQQAEEAREAAEEL